VVVLCQYYSKRAVELDPRGVKSQIPRSGKAIWNLIAAFVGES
jgi:hypothetical protein